MVNKFQAWKDRQDPKLTTNQIAEILGTSPGWVSTLLNRNEEDKSRRCSYDLAVKIWLMTGGDVSITELMTPPEDLYRLKKQIRKRWRATVKS